MNQFTITLDQFRTVMLAAGYDEVLERQSAPATFLDTHRHPFEANALVVQGEMWLGIDRQEPRKLVPGDNFHLRANISHTERYSDLGATYWVARKTG